MMSPVSRTLVLRRKGALTCTTIALLSACGGSGGGPDSGDASVINITASPTRYSQTMTVSVQGRGLGGVEVTVDGPCENLTRVAGGTEELVQYTCVVRGIGEIVPRVRNAQTRREVGSVKLEIPVPRVSMTLGGGTRPGTIVVELDPVGAPLSTSNFLAYVNSTTAYYRGTAFHQAIPEAGLMGGRYSVQTAEGNALQEKAPTLAPITPDAIAGLKNTAGTLAMVRDPGVATATTRFFLNVKDNPQFDAGSTQTPLGHAVFGRVVEGESLIEEASTVATIYDLALSLDNVPVTPITLTAISQTR
jgi:peptidyl-prolyl cis-trans isomerase A (cyclophilin A)